MTASRFDVCIDWAGATVLVGTLYAGDRSPTVGFEYSREWLDRADAFAIDPASLPLGSGVRHLARLSGALADTGPDRWGRVVIDRAVRQGVIERHPYRDIDYALAVEDHARIGAIRYRISGTPDFLAANRGVVPPLIQLRKLQAATDAVHGDRVSSDDLRFLLGAGSPLGGARPKCLVRLPDGRLAIAKFSKPDDVRDIAVGEFLALAVARAAGITTAGHHLEMVAGRGVAVIHRFDREGPRRVPFISACGLLGLPQDDPGSYTLIADAIRAHGDDVTAELSELFRRLVYSILVGNMDDHLRNHGFLMRFPGKWSLAPAYDINPAPMIDRTHGRQTPVSEESPVFHEVAAELDEAIARADRFGINAAAARAITSDVEAALTRWRTIGTHAGIPASALAAYADAFEPR